MYRAARLEPLRARIDHEGFKTKAVGATSRVPTDAEGGIRTRKGLLPGDFKSPVSACSTTPAHTLINSLCLFGSRRNNTGGLAGNHVMAYTGSRLSESTFSLPLRRP